MECVTKCEFQEFDGECFWCKLYEKELETTIEESKIMVHRCQDCIDDGTIGTNTKEEYVRKFKQHLGWMADNFYSFKDDFEEELTHLYRLIKELEDDERVDISKTT
jgi:hypothetical protein